MSFSITVKNELCRKSDIDDCCRAAELSAALHIGGYFSKLAASSGLINITTENAAFARRVYSQMKKISGVNPEVMIRRSSQFKKHVTYIVSSSSIESTEVLVKNAGLDSVKSISEFFRKSCCKKAFLRGAFLAGGALSDPEKTYHLEIASKSKKTAEEIRKLLAHFKLSAKIILRKGSYVVYLKEGENIVDFLNLAGAHSSLMEIENIRILKGMRNSVNRMVNCETANLEKTVNASVRQMENIRYIRDTKGLAQLPKNLREIAEVRLEHTDASLVELGQLLSPRLGKSGVNHRLRKLEELAERDRLPK